MAEERDARSLVSKELRLPSLKAIMREPLMFISPNPSQTGQTEPHCPELYHSGLAFLIRIAIAPTVSMSCDWRHSYIKHGLEEIDPDFLLAFGRCQRGPTVGDTNCNCWLCSTCVALVTV